MSAEIPSSSARIKPAAPPQSSPLPDLFAAGATIPPTPALSAVSKTPLAPATPVAATPKKDLPLPDIVLGGPQPFNAERSPLIRFIKLCTLLLKAFVAVTILGFMLYYYLSIANPKALPKYDPATGQGPTPFKALNQVLAMPAQVMGKTKDVVASNDARVADLDHVITVSEGKDGNTRHQGDVYRPPVAPEAESAPTTEAAPAAPRSAIGQIFALPGQVIGQTKAVVEKNNARTGVLDRVIANPEGMAKGPVAREARTAAATGPNTKPLPPTKTSVSSQDTTDLEQSLINFSLAQPTPLAPEAAAPQPTAVPRVALIPTPTPPAPTTPALAGLPKKIQLGGGITITTPGLTGTAEASEIFVAWVMNVKVSGISPGSPSRVVLNERLIREGDTVQIRLSIYFDGIDVAHRLLFFRDKSGATVSRSY
jgi:hypothetical protein